MSKRTRLSIKLDKGYKMVQGMITNSANSLNLKFDNKIIAIFYSSKSSNVYYNGYYANPTMDFYDEVSFDNTYPQSNPRTYTSSGSNYHYTTKLSDYELGIKNLATGNITEVHYIAILEDDKVKDVDLYLLGGTILYTDGEPTSESTDNVKSVGENQYKIKNNSLIHIANASYVDLSN